MHERRAVARRDLPLEVPQRLRPLRTVYCGSARSTHGNASWSRPLGAPSGRPLDDGAVPAGILPADPGAPQQLAVDPLRVHVVVVQADRPVGHGAVERRGRHPLRGDHRGIPAAAADGRQLGMLGGEARQPVQALLDRVAVGEA